MTNSAADRAISANDDGPMASSTHIGDLQTTLLSSPHQIETLAPAWDRLLDQSTDGNTFLTHAWLSSWLEAYRPAATPHVLTMSRGNQLVGLAPMMLTTAGYFGISMNLLRFIGDGTHESDHMSFVTDPVGAVTIHEALLDRLLTYTWDMAVFANVPDSSTLATMLPDWCKRHQLRLNVSTVACPRRSIPDSFDSLLASLPSRFRTAIRSTRRKLTASHTVEFGLHDDPADFDLALQSLFDNHESRWHAKGQTGVFVNPVRRKFYALITRRLHERGALRFFYLKLDGRTVAQEYCFAHRGTVYLLQEGFDFALAQQNIGNALRSYVFEYLIEQRYETYDFLSGVSRHKQNWSDAMPNDVTFTIARPTLKGRVAYFAPRIIEATKDRLRPLRDWLRSFASSRGAASGEARPE